ncbi:BatD family protein [Flavobacterium ardleyense]|uniref:BatD family protein n=1 Tax=Flavobacterium ardleyense TaxID=2038737 RepID=UPI00298CBBFE|nr:BatD family protein [Flavobacterium ardleyense]
MKNYLILFLLSINALSAQVQFEAKVTKQSLALNERVRVDFSMNADGDNFTPPSFDGFRIVAGPSQQVSQSWVNGRSSFRKTYSYILLPTQKGNLTIQQASIEIDNQIYKTAPIRLSVTAAVEQARDPNDTQVSVGDALHLVAEVSKTNPYINEPITVVYKLYFSYNIGITNWRELNKPKYNDFWSQNIDIKQLQVEEGTYKNERYRYVILRKTVLYPQKTGALDIEPLSLDIDVEVPSNRRTVFGQVITTKDHKRVAAGKKTLNVKALPTNGKPEDFGGAVGTFDFKVTPSKTTLNNGESLDLLVNVSGKGNLKLFDLPKPVVPAGLERYDAVRDEKVNTNLNGMSGRVTDSYSIVPQFKGNYTIKSMAFTYFDLSSNSYKTINSGDIVINVMDGPSAGNTAIAANNSAEKTKVNAQKQFEYIKLKSTLKNADDEDFFKSTLFYLLLAIPFAAVPFVIILKRQREKTASDIQGNKIKKSNKLAKKYLSEAKENLGNKELFYISLEKALHNFLKAKLQIETSEMSKETIQSILMSRNASAQTTRQVITLIENCDFARYAPSSNVAIQQDYDKAVVIISELEKQIK